MTDRSRSSWTPPPLAPEVATVDAGDVLFSSSRRFAIRTADRRRDAPFLAWLEDATDRLERAVGHPLPAAAGSPFLVVVRRDAPAPRIVRRLHTGSGGLAQTLQLDRPEELSPADILADSVALMAARYVAIRQPPDERDRAPMAPPDWLGAGLAGTLYAGPRQAAQRRALEAWSRAADPPLAVLLGPEPPRPPHTARDFWTTLVAWLRRRPDFPALCDRLFREAARGGLAAIEDIARMLDPAWTATDLEQEWDLALASLRRQELPLADSDARRAARLREALRLTPGRIPFDLPPDAPESVTPDVLLQRYGEPWSARLAAAMLAGVERLPIPRGSELERVAVAYRAVLADLARPVPGGGPLGAVHRAIARWALRRRLERADRELDDLEAICAAEEALPDPFSARPSVPPAAGMPAPSGAAAVRHSASSASHNRRSTAVQEYSIST